MNSLSSTPPNSTAPPLSDLIDKLREDHSSMLQRRESPDVNIHPDVAEIGQFVDTVAKCGRDLPDANSREIAQNIIDFWMGIYLARTALTGEFVRPIRLTKYQEQDNGPEKLSRAMMKLPLDVVAGKGEEYVKSLNHQSRETAERLMLALVRLKAGTISLFSVPFSPEGEFLERPSAPHIISGLHNINILEEKHSESKKTCLVLADLKLTEMWPFLRNLLEERKSLRELSYGWKRGGGHQAALLDRGALLIRAEFYRDLDDTEHDFLAASRKRAAQSLRKQLRLALGTATVLALLAAGLTYTTVRLIDANRELQAEKEDAEERLEASFKSAVQTNNLRTAVQDIAKIVQAPSYTANQNTQQILINQTNQISSTSGQFANVQAELFVSRDQPSAPAQARKYVIALVSAGITFANPQAEPRKKVPDPSEVRYFYPEDKTIADGVLALLQKAGLNTPVITAYTPDAKDEKTPTPRKFIQISLSQAATK